MAAESDDSQQTASQPFFFQIVSGTTSAAHPWYLIIVSVRPSGNAPDITWFVLGICLTSVPSISYGVSLVQAYRLEIQ